MSESRTTCLPEHNILSLFHAVCLNRVSGSLFMVSFQYDGNSDRIKYFKKLPVTSKKTLLCQYDSFSL